MFTSCCRPLPVSNCRCRTRPAGQAGVRSTTAARVATRPPCTRRCPDRSLRPSVGGGTRDVRRIPAQSACQLYMESSTTPHLPSGAIRPPDGASSRYAAFRHEVARAAAILPRNQLHIRGGAPRQDRCDGGHRRKAARASRVRSTSTPTLRPGSTAARIWSASHVSVSGNPGTSAFQPEATIHLVRPALGRPLDPARLEPPVLEHRGDEPAPADEMERARRRRRHHHLPG